MSERPGFGAMNDHALAAALADEAGQLLRAERAGLFARYGDDVTAIKDAADALAQERLAARLAELRPGDAVLSEEAPDTAARLSADRVWIIDPLDGTREYARVGRADWAVHVALWERTAGVVASGVPTAGELTAGAVALPDQELNLATASPHSVEVEPLTDRPLRVVVSGSRTPTALDRLVQQVACEVTLWGSAGAKAARVITGVDDIYLHDSDLNEWDAAAPVVVAAAHGLVSTSLDGGALRFNKPIPITGTLVMGRPDAVAVVHQALATA